MEHAGELLKGTQLTVENISERLVMKVCMLFRELLNNIMINHRGCSEKNF